MKYNSLKYSAFAIVMLLATSAAYAQDAAAQDPYFYERGFSIAMLVVSGVVILGALAALTHLLNMMVKVQQIKIYQEQGLEAYLQETKKTPQQSIWERLYKRWTNVVPVEREQEILLHHNYDGIRELDNSLPPWWTAMFYITIAFGLIYMVYYHFGGNGPSSAQEYEMEVQKAEQAVQAYLAKQSNTVDENTVEPLTDTESLALGKTIWDANCVACHGAYGEGGVGPNLTDDYWLHGNSIKDIFKTIKYGVPEKGMIAWKSQLRPADMHRVASYILTLHGTNPPNPKAPEGEKMEPQATQADSTANSAIGMK